MAMRKDFLWGGDISAAQVEGGWDEDGRAPTVTDFMTCGSKDKRRQVTYRNADGSLGAMDIQAVATLPKGAKYAIHDGVYYPNHVASDFYHRYKEDIALCAEMGFKALNISMGWSRIIPYGYKNGVNKKGVEFYRDVLKECRKYNIEPICTLYKYDMPVYYNEEMGGWSKRELIDEFVEYARVCFEEYKGLVKYWVTFNEINILMDQLGDDPEENKDLFIQMHNQLLASGRAVQVAHKIDPDYMVGCMVASMYTYPITPNPVEVINNQKQLQTTFYLAGDTHVRGYYPSYTTRIFKEYGVEIEISQQDKDDLMNGKVDFFAFSYYYSNCLSVQPDENGVSHPRKFIKNPYLQASDWGWQIDPLGLKYALHDIYDRYQLPMLIVENGLGAYDKFEDGQIHDPYRIAYLKEHIKTMVEACEEGVDLLGYTMWSCIDLCANSTGEISKRYGFIYVDADDYGNGTYDRYKKDSFYWYKRVIESNGKDLGD